jgi:hypothetical protein
VLPMLSTARFGFTKNTPNAPIDHGLGCEICCSCTDLTTPPRLQAVGGLETGYVEALNACLPVQGRIFTGPGAPHHQPRMASRLKRTPCVWTA